MNVHKLQNALLFAVLVILGCEEREPGKKTMPISKIERPALGKLEITRMSPNDEVQSGEVTFGQYPPYYSGRKPFTLKQCSTVGPSNLVLFYEFGNWMTFFIYDDANNRHHRIPSGARTYEGDLLLAEAKLAPLGSMQLQTLDEHGPLEVLQLEEYHYDANGKVVFYCKSLVGFPMGWKMREGESQGKKNRDFYFLWPGGAL